MSAYDHFPKAFLPITQRILLAFAKTLNEERARAVEEGLPGDIVLEGTLNTLLWFAARVAARIIFPGEDPDSMGGRARVARVQDALSQALMAIMAKERGSTGGPESHPWPDEPAGHA